jgi:hypothetical protein
VADLSISTHRENTEITAEYRSFTIMFVSSMSQMLSIPGRAANHRRCEWNRTIDARVRELSKESLCGPDDEHAALALIWREHDAGAER